jgi:hypothetical protein
MSKLECERKWSWRILLLQMSVVENFNLYNIYYNREHTTYVGNLSKLLVCSQETPGGGGNSLLRVSS